MSTCRPDVENTRFIETWPLFGLRFKPVNREAYSQKCNPAKKNTKPPVWSSHCKANHGCQDKERGFQLDCQGQSERRS
jgi:hypothetical protein